MATLAAEPRHDADDAQVAGGRHVVTVRPRTEAAALPQRLRIAHVIRRSDPEPASGVDRAVYGLSQAQADLGHAVARFVITPEGQDEPAPAPHLPWALDVIWAAGSFMAALAHLRALYRELMAWRADIVHLHSLHLPENVLLAHWLRRDGIRYCVSVHGAAAPEARRRSRVRKMLFHTLCERAYLNHAAFVHALTPIERTALLDCGVTSRIVVAPNGIQLPPQPGTDRRALLARFPALHGRRVFLYVGRLDPLHKGLDLLLAGFAQAEMPRAALVLVGPDWRGGRDMLAAQATRLGIADATIFAGPLFGESKELAIRGADVVVQTSRWEGVSLSVLEAAAMARPCLLTPAADPAGALGRARAAVVVEPDEGAIAQAIRRFVRMNDAELHALGERGRRIVGRTFSWPAAARTLLAAYLDVCCGQLHHPHPAQRTDTARAGGTGRSR